MFSELKYAVRSLAKTPWLTAVVVITLALGIAANTAVFSWTRGVLLHPLHGVADGQRLVSLETVLPNRRITVVLRILTSGTIVTHHVPLQARSHSTRSI